MVKDWKETNIIEMKAYIAVVIYQGMARLPQAIDHWGPYDLFQTTAAMYMKKRRYQLLNKFFSCFGTYKAGNNKRLQKIDILLRIPDLWRKYYTPTRELNVDETLIANKGKLKYQNFRRWYRQMENGIKIYICTDKSSYILNFKFFPKDEKTYELTDSELTKIVKEVCSDL